VVCRGDGQMQPRLHPSRGRDEPDGAGECRGDGQMQLRLHPSRERGEPTAPWNTRQRRQWGGEGEFRLPVIPSQLSTLTTVAFALR
jgi:hypothetical protein